MPATSSVLTDLPAPAAAEVAALAAALQRANGPLMQALNSIGGSVEQQLERLPLGLREGLGRTAEALLGQTCAAAARVGGLRVMPRAGARLHRLAVMATGAAGGAGGLASAVVELPATVTLIFGAMQKAARQAGFEPTSDEVRRICLEILGSGGPGTRDDGIDTAFLGARLATSRPALQAVIARAAPGFATVLGQKLASQAVPVLGAVAGAGVNYLFTSYFETVARVRFGLMRLAETHDPQAVRTAFRAEMARRITAPVI